MKKIGILTFHDAHNYGAMLQCYALQRFLQLEGHQVEVIDYRPPFYQDQYKRHKIFPYIGKNPWRTIRSLYYNVIMYNKRYNAFEKFHQQYIKLSVPLLNNEIPSDYDVYIIGSDQVWNPTLTEGFHSVFFCDFNFEKDSKLYVSYALSMENHSFSKEEIDYLQNALKRFDIISVRESSMIPLLQSLTTKKIHTVLDPTLLVGQEIWDGIRDECFIDKPYVVLYQIRESPQVRQRAKEIASRIGGEVVELTARIDKNYPIRYQTASPADFINLFRHASYVITTSFHGTAFSLIFNRPFYTYKLGDSFDSRSASLLTSVGLEGRMVSPEDNISLNEIDFADANKKISELRQFSRDFLIDALS